MVGSSDKVEAEVKRAFGSAGKSDEWKIGLPHWVLHDLRRTVRSGLASLHVPEEVAERVLNHAKKGLAKVYDRHGYAAEMRAALEKWADHVAFIVGDARDADNVTRLRA